MTLALFEDRGTPLARQRFTWRELAGKPISKLDDDAFTRVRIILMNGIEMEALRFSHAAARMNGDLRLPLAEIRRVEHHQATMINWLLGADHSPIETTIAYEQELREIREEEAGHAALLRTCLEQLGADPTAQTPSADLVGVASAGLLQAASDPRTTIAQTLQVALAAELIDVASWETLIAMAERMGQPEMAKRFGSALERENEHLVKVRGWFESLTLGTGEAARPSSKSKRKQN